MWRKNILVALLVVFSATTSIAQMVADPTAWSYDVKRLGGNKYELIFHLKLQGGWHIWAMQPGGDGYELPPKFTFDTNPHVQFLGNIVEKGEHVTTAMPGIKGKVTYLAKQVNYIQTVKVTGNAVITGKHQYQVCSETICLPPKTKGFSFAIRQ